MIEGLKVAEGDAVLDIGSGCGVTSALCAYLVRPICCFSTLLLALFVLLFVRVNGSFSCCKLMTLHSLSPSMLHCAQHVAHALEVP